MKQNILFAGIVIVLGVVMVWSAGGTLQTQALSQPEANDRTVTPKPTHCHGNGNGNGFGDDKCDDEPTLDVTEALTESPSDAPTEAASEVPTTLTEELTQTASGTPTDTPTPTPTVTATLAATPTATTEPTISVDQRYTGTWTAAFTLNRNTFTHEPRRQWFAWVIDLHQQGNQVTGRLRGLDISATGNLWGTVDSAGTFTGNMRLSWDVRDWQQITFTLNPDGSGGTGSAIYKQAENNIHYYDIQLVAGVNQNPPFPYAPPFPANPSGNFSGRWLTYFTLEQNTLTGETDTFWNAFFMDLTQNGNQVTGTLTAWDVNATGTINGTVNSSGMFNGVMRLSWDDHDWNSVSFWLTDDHASGYGSAVFQAAPDELHTYSIYLLYPSN